MRVFVIADSSKRKAKPIGVLTWEPSPDDGQGVFSLELCSDCPGERLPLSLSFCVRRPGRRATEAESMDWVRSRIVPEDRHNIASVLRANGLADYSCVGLFAACNGRSSDDDLLAYEVEASGAFADGSLRAGPFEPATDVEPDASPLSFADRVVATVRRRREGSEVCYAFVNLGDEPGACDAASAGVAKRPAPSNGSSAARQIGALIRSKRKEQGLTQKQLAARAGITQTVLSRTESGAGNPTLGLLEDIAAALGMRLDVSLGGSSSARFPYMNR